MSSDNEFEDTYDDESPVVAEKHTRGGRRRAPGGGGGGGMFEVNVSAGGLLEVCWRSAGGLPKGVGACGKTPPMEVCRRSAEGCVGA